MLFRMRIRKIAMSQRMSLSKEIKRSYCKHCYKAFLPGKTCRVRLQGKKIVYYCYSCKKFTRIPYNTRAASSKSVIR